MYSFVFITWFCATDSMPYKNSETRMHSSRMLTGRSLTVCQSLLHGEGGRCLLQGVCSRGRGVYSRGVCLLWGCVCSGGCLLLGGCLLWGGVCSWGVSAPWGVCGIPACTEADTPPVDRITDACKNITLAQLRCGR